MTDVLGDGISNLEYVDHMGSDLSVVRAARVSYSGDKNTVFMTGEQLAKDEKLIKYMATHGHTSPFEHTAVTFHVKCPLFVRSQWHRHRMASYNEVSRRYTSEDIEFYMPETWRIQDTKNKQGSIYGRQLGAQLQRMYTDVVEEMVDTANNIYDSMVKDDVAREQARMVLPQNLYTRFYYTANMHSIYHFWKLRADEHAQWEIRVYAEAIGDIMSELYPVSWEALTNA